MHVNVNTHRVALKSSPSPEGLDAVSWKTIGHMFTTQISNEPRKSHFKKALEQMTDKTESPVQDLRD